ncbi:tumor necrosis factor receptor superfamily member 19 [Rhinophrynus dorsalis]
MLIKRMNSSIPPGSDPVFKMILLILACLIGRTFSEVGDCREQEFIDNTGNCRPCRQCGPGKELSKDCGFGYGEDAQCLPCRPNRFKEDWGFQKCKPCLDCATVNRFQKANCTSASNAVCGECLPGFYRKTKLGGFQDMECVPCGDSPPPYEPHCNLVKISLPPPNPRDTALAAVICSALSTVLLALLILSVIYCKRQFMEKKPSWSNRSQDVQYSGSELSCFDRPRVTEHSHRSCCRCQHDPAQTCGPVHLIPSLCCDETRSLEHSCIFQSHSTLYEGTADSLADMIPAFLGSTSHLACRELAETWPLVQTPSGRDTTSVCEQYPEHSAGDSNCSIGGAEEQSILHTPSHSRVSTEGHEKLSPDMQSSKHLELLQLAACQPAEGKQSEEGNSSMDDDKQEV